MKIARLEPINHFQQSALASPGLDFCPPSTTLVLLVALCNGFHNTTLNLRSRSPLAHFELIYIYNRPTAVTYTQRRSRSIRSIFIPNDCTFGLFLRCTRVHCMHSGTARTFLPYVSHRKALLISPRSTVLQLQVGRFSYCISV